MIDHPTAAWRAMEAADLDAVMALAGRCHPALPESRAVFAERLALFRQGCLVLDGPSGVAGYAIAHPIRRSEPPALGMLLGSIATDADQFYLHDVVVAPELRGRGASAMAVDRLLDLGGAYPTTALVSVYGTAGFWSRFGFRPAGRGMSEKLRAYGDDAVFMERRNRSGRRKEERPSSA